ncbi:cytochrome c family protein [Haloferula helveola]|uniref:Cytochrome c family protein n=1 Tax=Haloferula helveola TaxID=490095 RepID=A0ABM7RH42_9BACT|nr:cytochrome c family protein [Haloferula helveola]
MQHAFHPLAVASAVAGMLLPGASMAWQTTPVADDPALFMPGSQPGSVVLPPVSQCTNCHADFNPVSEPHHTWQGSMMAQATRDPLWLATMAVAGQDSMWALGNANAMDLCLRCHTPTGWLGGRSDPTNGTALSVSLGDFDGVSCAACHHMLDPFPGLNLQPEIPAETDPDLISAAATTHAADIGVLSSLTLFDGSPFFNTTTSLPVNYGTVTTEELTNYIETGAGQMFVDPDTRNRRGPRIDVSTKSHKFYYSRYHKSRQMCHTCHDVSNPALAHVLIGPGTAETQSAASYFHVERTSSEFELSDYANPGGAPTGEPIAAAGVANASDCQDCHMPRVPGGFAKQGIQTRTDVASHQLTGGNYWMTRILASGDPTGPIPDSYNQSILDGTRHPGSGIEVTGLQGAGTALLDGADRALEMLEQAATIEVVSDGPGEAVLRIVNHTGHKLISGFPEGRRMWLNVRYLDPSGSIVSEINPYSPLVVGTDGSGNRTWISGGDLTITDDPLVYEAKMESALTTESTTFHFVLATDRHKDNRIPPRGFRIADASARLCQPRWDGADAHDYFTAEEYAGGFDEIRLPEPDGSAGWTATLYYQSTSKPYIEFLRDEINGDATTLLAVPPPSGVPGAYLIQTDPFFSTLKGWGDAIWDLWLNNEGSPPVAMTVAISRPRIVSMSMTGSSHTIDIHGLPGIQYQLEYSPDLSPDSWTEVGPELTGDGSEMTLSDPSPPSAPVGFYRVEAHLP